MRPRFAFTLIELLIAIFIVGLLAAILLPVFVQARAKAHQSACASNLRQLGAALITYCGDYDEEAPAQSAPHTLFRATPPVNIGWAGKIYGYVKNTEVFHCPGDPTHSDILGAQPVSYAINLNLAFPSHLAALTAPSHTLMLFEVTKSAARIATANEGLFDTPTPKQLSAASDGTTLLGWPSWSWIKKNADYPFVLYATGCLSNTNCDGHSDWYDTTVGRHQKGVNYLAADGHVIWLMGTQVSAGASAGLPSSEQSRTGCKWLNSGRTLHPCAEGTLAGKHTLTFSVQ